MTKNILVRWSALLLISFSVFFSCQTPSEDVRFENFLLRHERFYSTHFPQGKYNARDTASIFNLTDNDLFADIQFCNEQMEKLGSFELSALSGMNRENWKRTFQDLKTRLEEIEGLVNLRNEKAEE